LEDVQEINVRGTITLLTEAEKHGVKKVIYVSSSSVIGAKPGNAPGDESTPAQTEQLKNLYAKSKVLAEEAIDTFLKNHTLPVILILPTAMFGPGDAGPTSTGRLVQDFLERKIPGIVDGGMSVVDARDVAQAMLTAIEKGKSGERYIVSGGYLAIADVLKTLEKVSGVSAPTRHIPYTVTIAYASVLEWIGRVTGKPVLISREAVRLLHMKRKVISDKARRELAATSRPFEETIRDEVVWYRIHQHV
jgi:dihydroflavonol-4-reductase